MIRYCSVEAPYLTIREAAQKTGLSQSTVRRIIKGLVEGEHPDRTAVQPTPEKAEHFKKQGKIFAWKVREDILLSYSKGAQERERKHSPREENVVGILQGELAIKNQQIARQMDVISALNERLREGNILMGVLQKRLALPSGEEGEEFFVDVMQKPSRYKPSKKPSRMHPVKGFLRRIFAGVR